MNERELIKITNNIVTNSKIMDVSPEVLFKMSKIIDKYINKYKKAKEKRG